MNKIYQTIGDSFHEEEKDTIGIVDKIQIKGSESYFSHMRTSFRKKE